jgi:endonuclease/exonuclease/phosphatase (EEP) superfamily protein YafD
VVSWLLVGAWGTWTLIRLFGLERGFPLEAMMAFTPYVAATAIVPLVVAAALREWAAAAVAGAIIVILAILVLPRAFGAPTDADGGNGASLRVLAANVEFGKANPGELVDLAHDLDVDALSVEELTPKFAKKLAEAGIGELLPHSALAAAPRATGTGIYTRLALEGHTIDSFPSGFSNVRATVGAATDLPLELVAVHVVPPTGSFDWRANLEALPGADDAQLRVLLGDFNATLDQSAFRDLVDRGYDDVAATLGDGLSPTWPDGRRAIPPLVAIDHVLADQRIGIRSYSVEELPGSDHHAVFAELALPAKR